MAIICEIIYCKWNELQTANWDALKLPGLTHSRANAIKNFTFDPPKLLELILGGNQGAFLQSKSAAFNRLGSISRFVETLSQSFLPQSRDHGHRRLAIGKEAPS